MIKKQQLGEIKNLIDYEYVLNETRKKIERNKIKRIRRRKISKTKKGRRSN